MDTFTIGDLARRSGVSASSIRFYERTGVIPSPPRSESGYRRYSMTDVRRLQLVRRARLLGISTADLTRLAHDTFDLECQTYVDRLHTLFDRQRSAIDQRIRELETLRDDIDALDRDLDQRQIPAGLRVMECSQCFLMDEDSSGVCTTCSNRQHAPDDPCASQKPQQAPDHFAPGDDPLADPVLLDALACAIDKRPAGAPGILDLAPYITGVQREPASLIVNYSTRGRATMEAFVAAERLCCDSIEWNLDNAGTLRITATPVQIDMLAQVVSQPSTGRS